MNCTPWPGAPGASWFRLGLESIVTASCDGIYISPQVSLHFVTSLIIVQINFGQIMALEFTVYRLAKGVSSS